LRNTQVYSVLLTLLMLLSIGFQNYPTARASLNYAPGVAAGDTMTYGIVSVNSTTAIPTFDKNLTTIETKILSVDLSTNTVNASLLFSYSNGTTITQNIYGATDTDQGYLFPYIIAGGLQAGEPIFKPSQGLINGPLINETVNRLYAGTVRPVNMVNETYTGYAQSLVFFFDQATGFLLEVSVNETIPYPQPGTLSLHFKATATNAWSPETGSDFTLDAVPHPSGEVYLGGSTSFQLDLASVNGFTGTISLTTLLSPANATHPPKLSISQSSISLSNQAPSATTLVTVSTNSSTVLAVYFIGVNASSGSITHRDLLRLVVSPPDFEMTDSPANLTIAAGSSKNSTITIQSLGTFIGTINLSTSFYGTGVTANLSKENITLNTTVTSDTSILTVSTSASTLPTQTDVYVDGRTPSLYHEIYLPVQITGPDFIISTSPSQVTIREGQTGSSTVSVTSIDGFSGQVTLTTAIYGSSLTASLNETLVQLSPGSTAKATLTGFAGPTVPPGYYFVNVQGAASNGLTHYVYVTFNVTGPDFRFAASKYELTLRAGQIGETTLSLSSVDNFTGTLQLSVAPGYGASLQTSLTSSIVSLTQNATATDKLTVSVPPGTQPLYSSVQVTATSGIITHVVYISVQVVGPDFQISNINPFDLSIRAGGSGQTVISLTSVLNFAGNITLSSTGSPFVTSFAPDPVRLTANSTVTSTLTINVPKGTLPGGYFVGVTATNGTLTRSSSVFVQVTGPDIQLIPSPSSVLLQEGGTANVTLTVTSVNNFSGSVQLSYSSFGGLISFLPISTQVTLTANSTVQTSIEIFANGANPGYYTLQITASGGNLTRYADVQIDIIGPDFSINANPYSLSVHAGTSATSTISLASIDGFQGNVSLSVLGFYIGVKGTLANDNLTLASGGTATTTLSVNIPLNESAGFYQILVNATSGRLQHTAYISVQVIAPDFSIQASPLQLTLKPGQSAVTTITLTSVNGFNGTVNLSAFSVAGISWTFSETSVMLTPNNSTNIVLNVTATSEASGQTAFLDIYGNSGNLFHYTTVYVTIPGPSFSLGPVQTATIPQGGSGSTAIPVNSVNGFTGNVTLSIIFPNPSFQFSFNPLIVAVPVGGTVYSSLTITVSSNTYPGYYYFNVEGMSGNMTRYTFLDIQVTGPAYTITANPSGFPLKPGSSGNSTITLSAYQFVGQVSLSHSSNLPGLTVSLNPQTVTLNNTNTSATSLLTFTVPANASAGFYTLSIAAASGVQNQTIAISIQVTHPDFAIYSYLDLYVYQGSTTTDTITVYSTGGFSGPVQFNATFPHPDGLQATLNNSTVLVKPFVYNTTVTLTITASANATVEYNYVMITATSNVTNTMHRLEISIQVLAKPDFEIGASPTSLTFVQGSSAETSIILTSLNGFNGNISLSTTISPSGPTVYLANSVYVSGTATTALTVSAGTHVVGHFTVTVTGSAQGIAHKTTVQVYVAPMPDFAISAPSSLTVVSGQSATARVVVRSLNSFSGSIKLVASSSPQNVSAFLNPATVQLASGGSANTTLTISPLSVSPGQYTIKVDASAGNLEHSATISLTVHPAPDFVLTTPLRVKVLAGGSSSATISISPINCFSGSVNFTLAGPVDLVGSFSPNPLLGGSGSSSLTITASSGVPRGDYSVVVQAFSGSIQHSSSFIVTVTPPRGVPVTSTRVSWQHQVSLTKTNGTESWTMTVTNNGNIPVYVQVFTAGSSSHQSFLVRSWVVMILPKASVTITLNYSFSTPGKYNFATSMYYSTVIGQSAKLVSPRMFRLANGSFTVLK
jgi:uncharacterized membrane protein